MIGRTNAIIPYSEYIPLAEWARTQNVRFENDGTSVITTYSGNIWGNSGCSSARKFTQLGDYLAAQCTARASSASLMLGFSYEDPTTSYDTIRWAAYQSSGTFQVWEMGVNKYTGGSVGAGSRMRIHIDNAGTVRYYLNEALRYTSTVKATAPVLADLAFMNAGGAFDKFEIHGRAVS